MEQPSELQYLSLGHTQILGHEGTTLAIGWASSTSKPGTPALVLLDNKSDSDTWSIRLAHPFIRTRQHNLSAHLKYEQKDTSAQSLGAVTSLDKIRSVRTGLNYDRADALDGVNQALLEYSVGLNGMGATDFANPLKSRASGKPDYQKVTLTLSRKQELAALSPRLSQFSVNLSFMGQHTDAGLLSSEECGLGGQQFGRAYDSSEIVGARCVAASLELRFAANTEGTVLKYAQFYGFYDGGSTTQVVPLSATDPQTKSLSSTGLGVRFGLGPYTSGSVEVTKPLTRDVANAGNQDARVFASLSVRF